MKKIIPRINKRAWIILGVLIVLIVTLILIFRGGSDQAAKAFQTEAIQRGSLTATVGATGSVRARQSASLYWGTSGTVASVNAHIGDMVKQGQVLAELKKTSLPQNVILAEADLVTAQKALEDLVGSDTARAEALIALKDAQDAYDKAYNYRVELNKEGWFKKVLIKTVNHQQIAEIKWYRGYADAETIANAEDQLALRKAQLEDAQRAYDRLEAGPDPGDVTAAQARVEAAQATLNLARIIAPFSGTVTQAESKLGQQIAQSVLASDMAGSQSSATLSVPTAAIAPDRSSSGAQVTMGEFAFRMDDLSSLLVDVQISEVDINSVLLGQEATLTFDAILDRSYHGKVVEVSQAGNTIDGVVNFTVTVELADPDELVKPGMTAAVNIVVTQLEDALLVPNRAVRILDGDRVVYVLRDGQMTTVKVQLGQSSDAQSVVIGGDLKEGDLVILNPPSQGPGPFGG